MFIRKNCVMKQGFTLIELLMAIGIFVLGSMSVWTLYFSAIETHKQSLDDQNIAWLSNILLAELKKTDITVQTNLKPIRQGKFPYYPDYSYDIDFLDLGNSAVGVNIKIYYQRKGKIHFYAFHTVVHRVWDKKTQ